jgi:hypothetical protein
MYNSPFGNQDLPGMLALTRLSSSFICDSNAESFMKESQRLSFSIGTHAVLVL